MPDSAKSAARAWPAAVLAAALPAFALEGSEGGLVAALVLGTCAAGISAGIRNAALFSVAGLLLAGLLTPIALEPWNHLLTPLALALALLRSWKPLAPLALLIPLLVVPEVGLTWSLCISAGMIAARFEAPRVAGTIGVWVLGAGAVVGAAMTLNAGFIRVTNTAPRAVLVDMGDKSELLAPGQTGTYWTRGRSPAFRLTPSSASFDALPAGGGPSGLEPTAVDRAEADDVDCGALAPLAVAGDLRAQVQHIRADCAPALHTAQGPAVDAARVLSLGLADDEAGLQAHEAVSPLSAPDAMVLVAKARLGNVRPAALMLVEGSPYDRAALVDLANDEDRAALEALIESWAADLPESVRGPYSRALAALRARPAG